MANKLAIYNPSSYQRGGHVSTPWKPIYDQTRIPPAELILRDGSGNELTTQIDKVDPEDASRDILSFSLAEPVQPGPEDYSSPSAFLQISKGKKPVKVSAELGLDIATGSSGRAWGVLLYNSQLKVFINLANTPGPDPLDPRNWYAGSVTSVQLGHDKKEMLDRFVAEILFDLEHDPEKRLQLDYIQLARPNWETSAYEQVDMFNRSYRLISQAAGPVRVSLTIVSEPFDYRFFDPFARKNRVIDCRLYRILSLYSGSDYLIEELFVKGILRENNNNLEPVNLIFMAQYFAHMDMGKELRIYQFPFVPDWMAIGVPWPPYHGYGFATDMHIASQVASSLYLENYKRFSWQLSPSKMARCLHLFMYEDNGRFDNKIGHLWYEEIYKPLKAQ